MRFLIALLAVAGLVVSILALKVHNMDPSQAPPCKVEGKWDCGAVNHSRFAVFPPRTFDEDPASPRKHIPIAVFGIAGYTVIALLALFGRLRIVLHLAEIGFLFASFLSYLEAFVMEKWCIYCVWSQGLITAILLSTIFAVILSRRPARRSMFA
jgi:vitamin-K-epoxide reductase (warfarin-sensitive)